MSADRNRRRRAEPRPPRGVALRATCLLLGFAAAALLAGAALAPHEPSDELPAQPQPAPARRAAAAALAAALPPVDSAASPAAVRAAAGGAAAPRDAAPRAEADAPRPGTERAFYEQDLLLAARPGALAERARQLFVDGEGADRERVAALRALWDSATAGAADWFALALRAPPEAPPPRGTLSVGEFAVGFLGDRAAREPAALELLAQLTADSAAPRALRRSAALSVAATADAARLRRLATDVAADDDPDFRAALARAAARNAAPEAATLFTSGTSCYGRADGASGEQP